MKGFIQFIKAYSWPFGIAMGLAAAADRLLPKFHMSGSLFVFLLAMLLALMLSILNYKFERPDPLVARYKVKRYIRDTSIMLIEGSDVLHNGMGANLYYSQDGYELMAGVGDVINVQSNGLVQLKIDWVRTLDKEVRSGIDNNSKGVLQQLRIRPAMKMLGDFDGQITE